MPAYNCQTFPSIFPFLTTSNCFAVRNTQWVEFRKVDKETGQITVQGLNLNLFDPRSFMHHDCRDAVAIEILTPADNYLEDDTLVSVEQGACWETETKDSADLDIYYEASNALPMILNEKNVFDFAPINSEVSIKRNASSVDILSTN